MKDRTIWTPDQGLPDGARAAEWLREQRRRERYRWRHVRDQRVEYQAAALVQTFTPTSDDASDTGHAISCSATGAGNLIAIWVVWEGATTTVTITGDGTLSAGTAQAHANTDLNGQWHYKLASGGGVTSYTVTWSAARPFKKLLGFEFSYSGTASLDTQATATGSTNNAVISSGNMTVDATAQVVLGANAPYNSSHTVSAQQINAVNADGTTSVGAATAWYRLISAGFTGASTCTMGDHGGTPEWVLNGIAFKVAAGGGSNLSVSTIGEPVVGGSVF